MAYVSRTLADLRVTLNHRVDNARFWTDEEARRALNETLRDWNLLTGKWRRRATYSTTAGTHEYRLGASLTYGMAVKYQGTPLLPGAIWDLDVGRPTWRGETTASGGAVPTIPTVWVPISLQQIAIWPADAATTVGALTVDGVAATPVLVEDADFVDLGEEQHDLILDYALHLLSFKLGGPQWEATHPLFLAFLQAAAEENGRLKANQKFRRAAGLDRRRDLQPTKGVPTQIDDLPKAVESSS